MLLLVAVNGSAAAAESIMKPGKVFRDCPDCPEMVMIPSGSFDMGEMGSTHRVMLQRFAMGKTEVTQGQWKAIMDNNPSAFLFCGDSCPVDQVSWNDAQAFIQKLSVKTGKQYRLPSESEWEYACRAGGRQEYCGSDDVNSVAWYGIFSLGKPHPVGGKNANVFGLYDMSGNVWEWVGDSYHANFNGAPSDGSVWQGDSAERVLRGSSWDEDPLGAGVALRNWRRPEARYKNIGFRVARTFPQAGEVSMRKRKSALKLAPEQRRSSR